MERLKPIRWIVNADDFGRSSSINTAVEKAHREGILTSASLMVNEPACAGAVEIAGRNPNLGVGLHLTLCCGRAASQSVLANAEKHFTAGPVTAGLKIFLSTEFKRALEAELEEQFKRFEATGLVLDHVNGHLNIHLHPTVLGILLRRAQEWGITRMRLTQDPWFIDKKLSNGKLAYRLSHAMIYHFLSKRARKHLAAHSIKHADYVFGLLRFDRIDEQFYLGLLPLLHSGTHEIYSHPSDDASIHELNALTSERVKQAVREHNVQLVRYQDL